MQPPSLIKTAHQLLMCQYNFARATADILIIFSHLSPPDIFIWYLSLCQDSSSEILLWLVSFGISALSKGIVKNHLRWSSFSSHFILAQLKPVHHLDMRPMHIPQAGLSLYSVPTRQHKTASLLYGSQDPNTLPTSYLTQFLIIHLWMEYLVNEFFIHYIVMIHEENDNVCFPSLYP